MENGKNSSCIFSRVAGILLFAVIISAVVSVTLSAAFLPTIKIGDDSMSPYKAGDTVLCLKRGEYKQGDIVAFRVDDQVYVKRIAATANQWVDMDEIGNIYVNNKALKEQNITNIGQGTVTINLPCQVPENCVFVLSDNLSYNGDSRSAEIGCVNAEQITGKVMFRLWG